MAPKDITDEGDWLRGNKIFADHTILEKAWHAKTEGPQSFRENRRPVGQGRRRRRRSQKGLKNSWTRRRPPGDSDHWVDSLDNKWPAFHQGDQPDKRFGETNLFGSVRCLTATRWPSPKIAFFVRRGYKSGPQPRAVASETAVGGSRRRTHRWPECLDEMGERMTTPRFVTLADEWLARKAKQ